MPHRRTARPRRTRRTHVRSTRALLAVAALATLAACAACAGERADATTGDVTTGDVADTAAGGAGVAPTADATTDAPPAASVPVAAADPADAAREPNELGRIPVLEYHLIVPEETGEFTRTPERLRRDLEELRRRGYVPVNMVDVLDRTVLQQLPRGKSPVVLVFDDASPSQFRYVERDGGTLEIDPTSAVGILERFADEHADWPRRAVFCMLPAAQVGRSFFGDKGIEGQKTEWRFRKVQFLHERGYELCNHTLYHARLDRAGDRVQEFIARGDMAIDSAVPGYRVRTFALPLGMWPKTRAQAVSGSWTDPTSGRTVRYQYDAVLEVSGGPTRSPYDPAFDGSSVTRSIMYRNALETTLDQLDRPGPRGRYVSDGDPATVARPATATADGAR